MTLVRWVLCFGLLATATPLHAEDAPANKTIEYLEYHQNAVALKDTQQQHLLSAEAFLQALAQKDKKVLLDVRSPEEYACGHITGAVNVSLSEMTEETLAKIIPLKNTKIIIYCNNSLQTMPTRMISMTTQAYPTLYQLGYQNLYLLQDGYKSSKGALSRIPLELSADAMQKCRFLAELKGKPKP